MLLIDLNDLICKKIQFQNLSIVISTFLIKPFISLILIGISCSLLGVFVLWKKLSYFGDGLSHSILLGFVLGTLFNVNQIFVLAFFAIFFAFLVGFFLSDKNFSKDTIIAISSYFCLSLAAIINDISVKKVNFGSYVFGDILTIADNEIAILGLIAIITICYVAFAFKRILLINLNEDLAKVEGLKVGWWKISFLVLLALTIAFSVKIVGVFLMTALLILPAAIARIFAVSAKNMLVLSLVLAIFALSCSFKIADIYDLTVSSAAISALCLIFSFGLVFKKFKNF